MTGKDLLNIMLHGGVPMTDTERIKVEKDLQEAIDSGQVRAVEKGDETIGFVSYKKKNDGKMLVNYAFIYEAFRGRETFMYLRKFFRGLSRDIYWKSRRRNRLCLVK